MLSTVLLPYPFLRRYLTIIDTLTIGDPSFFLAAAAPAPCDTPGADRPRNADPMTACEVTRYRVAPAVLLPWTVIPHPSHAAVT